MESANLASACARFTGFMSFILIDLGLTPQALRYRLLRRLVE